MVTTVGLQDNFMDALKELIELDHDAVSAYEAAINRLENEGYKKALKSFKADHESHIEVFSDYLSKINEEVPSGPGMKSLLTQGKVVLANLFGDEAILGAMKSNEVDTNTAYERMNKYEDAPADIKGALKKGLEDEKRHAAWLQGTLENK